VIKTPKTKIAAKIVVMSEFPLSLQVF